MDITIIGTGNMGRGIATRALAGGPHRHPARPRARQGRGGRERAVRRRPHGHRRRQAHRRCRRARGSGTRHSTTCWPIRRPARRQGRRRHHQLRRPQHLPAVDRRGRLRRPGRQGIWGQGQRGLQHHLRGQARRRGGPGQPLHVSSLPTMSTPSARSASSRGPQGARRPRRATRPRPPARSHGLPAHGHPKRPRHRLRQHHQGPRVTRRRLDESSLDRGGAIRHIGFPPPSRRRSRHGDADDASPFSAEHASPVRVRTAEAVDERP